MLWIDDDGSIHETRTDFRVEGYGVGDRSFDVPWKYSIYEGIAWTPKQKPACLWSAIIGVPTWSIVTDSRFVDVWR